MPEERPAKRVKVADCKGSEEEEDEDDEDDDDDDAHAPVQDRSHDHVGFVRMTAIDAALPEVAADEDAIEQYEVMRASQLSQSDSQSQTSAADHGVDAAKRLDERGWVRGKSSIYVDAFNLALDTVLEDEAHLFDEKEKHVFARWHALNYQAQYLYVRLFLRKSATWHRIERLGYYGDISDVSSAIAALVEPRTLPLDSSSDAEEECLAEDTFSFADDSEASITTMEEASSLLSLDELKTVAKDAKVQGKNKAELLKAFRRVSSRQSGLMAVGLRRSGGTQQSIKSGDSSSWDETPEPDQNWNRNFHFITKILAITGPLIRLSEAIFKLFERVHLVFYRSTEWTEKSLTAIILAKISRWHFPDYIVCRSTNIFPSRKHLLEFERSMRQEFEVDKMLELNGPPGQEGLHKVLSLFDAISTRWRDLIREEQGKEDTCYEFGEGAYLRRFTAAHAYTRIAHKAAYVLGRLHRHAEEHALLAELLAQRLFHPARRGAWYQRKALLEEHYMWEAAPAPAAAAAAAGVSSGAEARKKHWRRAAAATCAAALEDRDCHLIHHYDLQKRLVKLERRLRIPRRLQHDFGHVRLRLPEEHVVQGVQLIRRDAVPRSGRAAPSTKTLWLDEAPGADGAAHAAPVSVEDMCLTHYRARGWKGYHAEGGILRTLFGLLFFDVLFGTYVPGVFQTAFQTCPLDLHTDGFYAARASAVEHRLAALSNGGAAALLRAVDARERPRRTCVVGVSWDYALEDLLELVGCFGGAALAAVCKVMAQEYRVRGGGVPDLVLWRTGGAGGQEVGGEVMFAEVKSANDRLSDTQRLWIHVLTGAGVCVALCNAVAREVREMD
ncbi:hypothetical protein P8C59_005606 [Phyllachora maydis]|uniref:Fanconi-associated nuclease n=1 Tax=Phyllachora maydis TaxID=1825666 RepID=A0AAD9MBM0_9PEZI|nr:hypothetical protein P8C59_005606 [Phyllachora maydis]